MGTLHCGDNLDLPRRYLKDEMAWNCPRNSPELISALSAGKLGSRTGVDISVWAWLNRRSSCAPALIPPSGQRLPWRSCMY